MNSDSPVHAWLQRYVDSQGATAGTVHLYENDGLKLAASVNIPPPVQQVVAWVPNGKGMAGLALQRKEPVQTCNLQEDTSGDVKPGAKAVNAQAAVALPVFSENGDVFAVVGIAFAAQRDFSADELKVFTESASSVTQAAAL